MAFEKMSVRLLDKKGKDNMRTYQAYYKASIENRDEFWGEEAKKLHWFKPFDKVLDDSRPPFYRWFVGGKTNLCLNAVDRHALGSKKDKPAIIWESPETGHKCIINFGELYNEVNKVSIMLRELGVQKGDRVIIYMPMVPEAIIAMLATVRLGAIHSVVFAGFSVESLADRIDDAKPKVLLTADAGKRKGKVVPLKPIVDKALGAAREKIEKVVVLNRGLAPFDVFKGRDLDWVHETKRYEGKTIDCVEVDSTDPSYILYTSGTTGKPKGVVRDTGGHMVALHASMEHIYAAGDRDIYWSTSDIGWVVGHSYIVYGPLLKGIPTVVFEGTPDYPNPDVWWELIERHKVTVMFSAPTAMRILRKFPDKWLKKHDTSSLRYLFLAGEPLDEPTWKWASEALGVTVIDHYWQTETGWAILTNTPGIELLPIKPGSPTKPAMGYACTVVDEKGDTVSRGEKGYLAIEPPLPPGNLSTIWGGDDKYIEAYWKKFPGKLLYATGDYAIEDKDGYFWMLGRADEVINIAGHRLGTREVEEVISSHGDVAEASAIGVDDELKGQAIAVFAVLKHGVDCSQGKDAEIKKLVRDRIGPIAVPRELKFVHALPKTRSGKVMRRVLKALCEGKSLGDMSTLEDGATVDEIQKAISKM